MQRCAWFYLEKVWDAEPWFRKAIAKPDCITWGKLDEEYEAGEVHPSEAAIDFCCDVIIESPQNLFSNETFEKREQLLSLKACCLTYYF